MSRAEDNDRVAPASRALRRSRFRDATWVLLGYSLPAEDAALRAREPLRKIDLAERAYKEVLDATKHQDDKVGRFLTAIAFLTTGAIALIATDEGLRRRFSVPDGGDHALLAWSTGFFFAFTLAAVVLLLLCLSVPVRLPRTRRDPMTGSHLFYSYIAARPRDKWVADWETGDDGKLEQSIAEDYVLESHNLAERVSAKYRHSYEASWLFIAALLFLGISIYLRLLAVFTADGNAEVTLATRHLAGLAIITSAHVGLQTYTRAVHDLRSMQKAYGHTRYKVTKRDEFARDALMYRQRRWTLFLVVPAATFSAILASPVETLPWGQNGAALAVGLVTIFGMWRTRNIWDDASDVALNAMDYRSWLAPVLVSAFAGGAVWFAIEFGGLIRMTAVVLPALLLSAVNASRPAMSNYLARNLQRELAAAEGAAAHDASPPMPPR